MRVQEPLFSCECLKPYAGDAGVWAARAATVSVGETHGLCFSLPSRLSEAEHLCYLQHLCCSDLAVTPLPVIFHSGVLKTGKGVSCAGISESLGELLAARAGAERGLLN